MSRLLPFAIALLALTSCQAGRISFLKIGGDKDLKGTLLDDFEEARDELMSAQAEFTETYNLFTRLNQYQAGELERIYEDFQDEFADCEEEASDLTDRMEKLDATSTSLFEEWNTELELFHSPAMRQKSEELLRDAEGRYAVARHALKELRQAMDPVLLGYRDYILFFNHNLNPRAIATLGEMNVDFEDDVVALHAELESAREAMERFLDVVEGRQAFPAPSPEGF